LCPAAAQAKSRTPPPSWPSDAVDAKTKEDVAVYRGAVLANGDLDRPRSTPSLAPRGEEGCDAGRPRPGQPRYHQPATGSSYVTRVLKWAQTFHCDPNHRPPRSRQRVAAVTARASRQARDLDIRIAKWSPTKTQSAAVLRVAPTSPLQPSRRLISHHNARADRLRVR
jgi:hypothetical protein